MSRLLSKALCLLLAAALLCSLASFPLVRSASATAGDLEEYVPQDLTPEELALWESWANEASEDTEIDAESAEALSPEEEAAMAELQATMDQNLPMDEVDLSNLEPNPLLPDSVFNILLLGVDNRSTDLERGLSDAVIICSVNLDTGSVKLTSIARDTAVIVPGFKDKNRINVAYKRGGPELAMKTVNRNFDMNVQRYVVVNIHGLADIIDTLGGVDISMTSKEAGRINFELRKEPMDKVKREKVKATDGVHHLDGMQAVTFARIRGIDSDLERTRRQRQLLEVLLSTVMKDMDIPKLLSLVETALPYGQTNLTLPELIRLGTVALGGEAMRNFQNGGEIMEQLRIPVDKRFGYKEFHGADLIYLSDRNLKFSIETIHNFIYGAAYLEK